MVMVGKRGSTTINFNMLGGVNSDCFRIALHKYIFGWACCGGSGGGAVKVMVVDYWWWC